mgnify:CR=1 FL=1
MCSATLQDNEASDGSPRGVTAPGTIDVTGNGPNIDSRLENPGNPGGSGARVTAASVAAETAEWANPQGCPECGRLFQTARGLSQHRRKAHPDEYALASQQAHVVMRNMRWTESDKRLLAERHSQVPDEGPRVFARRAFTEGILADRSLESLRGRIRQQGHQTLKEEYLQRQVLAAPAQTNGEPHPNEIAERVEGRGEAVTTPCRAVRTACPECQQPHVDGHCRTPGRIRETHRAGPGAPPSESARVEHGSGQLRTGERGEQQSTEILRESADEARWAAEMRQHLVRTMPPSFKANLAKSLGMALGDLTEAHILDDPGRGQKFEEWFEERRGPPRCSKRPPKGRANPKVKLVKRSSRTQRKKYLRALTLNRYKKDPNGTCKAVVADTLEEGKTTLPPGTVDFWKKVFSPPADGRNIEAVPEPAGETLWRLCDPITWEEYRQALRALKDSSPGWDGISKDILEGIPFNEPLWFYNLWLYTGKLPDLLKQAVTTLIPKGDDVTDPAKFRPITVSSMLLRLFHKILGTRGASVPLSHAQKGFRPFDGIGQNVYFLKAVMRQRSDSLQATHIAFCDIRKAFDSVKHESLLRSCRWKGIPPPLLRYLEDCHRGNTTVLKGAPACELLPVTVGVRQGDPLSTHLFNWTMDFATRNLPDCGVDVGGRLVSLGMFADDSFLIAESQSGLQALLKKFTQNLSEAGLTLHPGKCSTMSIRVNGKKKKTYVDDTSCFKIYGERIPAMSASSTYKYLGVHMGVARTDPGNLANSLQEKLDRLVRSYLPTQAKIHAIRTILVPSLHHQLTLSTRNDKFLKRLDMMVRGTVKRILHMPKDTPTAYIYAQAGDGGLGVPSVYVTVKRLRRERAAKLMGADDPVIRYLSQGKTVMREVGDPTKGFARIAGKEIFSKEDIQSAWKSALYKSVDGKGLGHHTDDPENKSAWVTNLGPTVTSSEFISAVNVRCQTLPTKSRVARTKPGQNPERRCRECPDKESNLASL